VKFKALILILTLSTWMASGQNYSLTIDSLTKNYLSKLPKDVRSKFDPVLKQRSSTGLPRRLDTTGFDFALVEEFYTDGDTLAIVTERYFTRADSQIVDYITKNGARNEATLPRYYYLNGTRNDPGHMYFSSSVAGTFYSDIYEYHYTLDTVLKNYGNMRPLQEMIFDPTIAVANVPDTSAANKKELELQVKEKLKKTYQVITLVDKADKHILVSIQLPPGNPMTEVRFIIIKAFDW
jgi:hypothetical protein